MFQNVTNTRDNCGPGTPSGKWWMGPTAHVIGREHAYSKGLEEGAFWRGSPILLGVVTPSLGGFEPFWRNLTDAGGSNSPWNIQTQTEINAFWTPIMGQAFIVLKEYNRGKVHSTAVLWKGGEFLPVQQKEGVKENMASKRRMRHKDFEWH